MSVKVEVEAASVLGAFTALGIKLSGHADLERAQSLGLDETWSVTATLDRANERVTLSAILTRLPER